MTNEPALADQRRTTRIAKIAATLTPAQRTAIMGAWQASWGEWFVPTATNWRVRHGLLDKKLCSRKPAMPLFALGIQIRNHLLAMGDK